MPNTDEITKSSAKLNWSAGSPAGSATVTDYWAIGSSANVTYESNYLYRGTTTSLFATRNSLSAGTYYYWTVRAATSCNNSSSAYSTAISFLTPNSCTLTGVIPGILSPGADYSPGPTIPTTTPTLTWNAVPGATNYYVAIRNILTNTLVLEKECAASGTSYTVPSGVLSNNGQYRWNIKATAGCGSNCVSDFSLPLFFTVSSCIPPESPTSATTTQTSITKGQSTTLQLTGGALNNAPYWIWYESSCGGRIAGTGSTLVVSPLSTTTYYVQAMGCGVSTPCRSVTINVCEFLLSSGSLNFTSLPETKTVSVFSGSSWSVSSYASWITLKPSIGNGDGIISVEVSENKGAERAGIVTITGCNSTESKSVLVSQGGETILISSDQLKFSAFMETQSITITSNCEWTATDDASWITILPAEGKGKRTLLIIVSENKESFRSGTVTIQGCNILKTISILQEGLTDIPVTGQNEIAIYPNPTKRLVYIRIPDNYKNLLLKVLNPSGQEIISKILDPGTEIFDLSGHPPGLYYFNLFNGEVSFTEKIVLK